MALIINLIYFAILIFTCFKYLNSKGVESSVRMNGQKIRFRATGPETVLMIIIATGITGFLPILALHLAFAEVMCIVLLFKAPNSPIVSFPIKIFGLFLIWAFIGIFYSTSYQFGVRMMLKYIYAPLVALTASAIVDHVVIFYKTAQWGRRLALLSFIAYYLPMSGFIFLGVFWNRAGLATNYTIWMVFSFALYMIGINRKQNLRYGLFFILPCIIWVFRTNIFGTSVALSAFFFIKYRLKAIPLVLAMAVLAVCALFYIPSVKAKMYFRPSEVTIEDFLTGNVAEDNINTSGRNEMWKKVTPFYEEHKWTGSGTGRVQTYFYTEIIGFGRGGQLHNELLLIKCDNGLIGLGLFLLSYIAILLHCVKLYHGTNDRWVRLCALTAGASLLGILVTLYSDNTISYSLATLGIPWAFYGMAMGINRRKQSSGYGKAIVA